MRKKNTKKLLLFRANFPKIVCMIEQKNVKNLQINLFFSFSLSLSLSNIMGNIRYFKIFYAVDFSTIAGLFISLAISDQNSVLFPTFLTI